MGRVKTKCQSTIPASAMRRSARLARRSLKASSTAPTRSSLLTKPGKREPKPKTSSKPTAAPTRRSARILARILAREQLKLSAATAEFLFPFLQLPIDVRKEIYDIVIAKAKCEPPQPDWTGIFRHLKISSFKVTMMSLRGVSKEVRDEFSDLYFRTEWVHIRDKWHPRRRLDPYRPRLSLNRFVRNHLAKPDPEYAGRIRHLNFPAALFRPFRHNTVSLTLEVDFKSMFRLAEDLERYGSALTSLQTVTISSSLRLTGNRIPSVAVFANPELGYEWVQRDRQWQLVINRLTGPGRFLCGWTFERHLVPDKKVRNYRTFSLCFTKVAGTRPSLPLNPWPIGV